jgi:hypothetical protein
VRSTDYSELQLDSAFTFSLLAGAVAALGLGLLAVRSPACWPSRARHRAPGLPSHGPLRALAAPLMAECRRALDFRTVGRHQLFSRALGLAVGIHRGRRRRRLERRRAAARGDRALDATLLVRRKALPGLRIDWPALRPILAFSQYIAWTAILVQATERLF